MPTPTSVHTLLKPEVVLRNLGIRAGWKVADFGCGPGYYLVPAARFVGPTGRVVGIDLLATAVDEAKKRARAAGAYQIADVFRADVARPRGTGLPDNWADLVLLSGLLAQSDARAVLTEAARVVKPEAGRVAVIEWDEVATPLGPPPEQRISRTAVLAAAKLAGLTRLETFTPSPYQYGLLFLKPIAA